MQAWLTGVRIITLSFFPSGLAHAWADVSDIQATIEKRRSKVETLLQQGKVGETLDGRLWKFQCEPVDLVVVAEENTDRASLARALAKEKGMTSREVTEQLTEARLHSLTPGWKRQVVVNGAAVWWDGQEPSPAGSALALTNAPSTPGGSKFKQDSAPSEQISTHDGPSSVSEKATEARIASLQQDVRRLQAQLAAADQRVRYFEQKGAESHLRLASANAHLLYTQSERLKVVAKVLGDNDPKLAPLKDQLGRLASDYRSHVVDLAEFDKSTVDGAVKELQAWFSMRTETKEQASSLKPILEDVDVFRSGKTLSTDDLREKLLDRLEALF
jgi:uncharacterized protein YdbL (DUF1318 family)